MRRACTILTLAAVGSLATVVGCDSATMPPVDNDETVIPKRTVIYEVAGTYRTCSIVFRNLEGVDVDLQEVALDWIDSVKVDVTESFLARASATCADIEREGKATIRLFVDGLLVESDDMQGFGDSGSVQRLLAPTG